MHRVVRSTRSLDWAWGDLLTGSGTVCPWGARQGGPHSRSLPLRSYRTTWIESRDVVEKCAPSSGMVSYGLRWFCSLLSLERREKLVHRAGAEGAAGHQPLLMDLLQHGSHKA